MGFWSITCKVANGVGKAACVVGKGIKCVIDHYDKIDAESNQYLDKYRELSKEELISKYKSSWSNSAQKLAAMKVMREKGYTNQNEES